MRFAVPIGLALAVGQGVASPIISARHTPDMAPILIPVQKAYKLESFTPTIPRAGVKALRMRYGPYTLRVVGLNGPIGAIQGATMLSQDPSGTTFSYRTDSDFPKDITVLRTKTTLSFADGSPAGVENGVYNHHTLFSNTNRMRAPATICENSNGTSIANPSVIIGAEEGGEAVYTTLDGSFNSGFYIGKDDVVILAGDIVNYNKEEKVIYFDSDIEYVPGKVPGNMESGMEIMELNQCVPGADSMLHPPEGKKIWSLAGPEMLVAQTGYLVSSRGHLHDGGVNLVMKINGKVMCNSEAVYGGPGKTGIGADGKPWTTIGKMTLCPPLIKITKGDKITLESNYDLVKHPARVMPTGMHAEEMATFLGTFAVEN